MSSYRSMAAAAARYAGRSLLRRPAPMVGLLFDRSPVASGALALPSSSLCRCFSSNGSSSTTTRKDLTIELMSSRPIDVKSSAENQIRRLDKLLDLLEVHHQEDKTMQVDVAVAAATRAVEEKKQELALLLHKVEVEGGDDKDNVEIREKTAEFTAAACRLRDLLLPQAQRDDIENHKGKIEWLENKHGGTQFKIFLLTLATVANFVLVYKFSA